MTTQQQASASSDAVNVLIRRFGARLIDSIIVAVVVVALGFAMGFSFVWLAIGSIGIYLYFVVGDVVYGTTAGKRLLGYTVRGPGGEKPAIHQAAIRELFTLIGAIPFAGGPLAFVAWIVIAYTIYRSASDQGLHDDLAGGTRVVAS